MNAPQASLTGRFRAWLEVGRQGFEPWTLGLKVWVSGSIVVHQRPIST